MQYLGNYLAGSTIGFKFSTHKADGTPITLSGTPAVSVYKRGSTTESTSGTTLTVDYDSRTGLNAVVIDLSSDSTFYSAGYDYDIVITTGTVNSISVVGYVVGTFSIEHRFAVADVTRIGGVAQSDQYVKVSSGTGTGQVSLNSGAVTVYDISNTGLASIWGYATRTLTSFGTLVSDIWASATRTLTAFSDSSGVTTLLSRLTSTRAANLDNLDAAVSTRAAAATALSNLTWTDAKAGYLTGPAALEATLTAIKGAEWSTQTLAAIDALILSLGSPLQDGNDTLTALGGMLENPGGATPHDRFKATALEMAPSASSSAPTVQDIWDHNPSSDASGTAGYLLKTAGSGGIPSDVLAQISAIEAGVAALQGSTTIAVASPIGAGGNISMLYGYDYKARDGMAVTWTNAEGSWPNLTGATVKVVAFDGRTDQGGTCTVVTATGVNQTVRWEVEDNLFDSADKGTMRYILQATLSNGDVIPLTEGNLIRR